MGTTMAWVGVVLMVGCGTGQPGERDAPAADRWGAPDAGTPAVEGAALRVEEAWWSTARELRVATAIENRSEAPMHGLPTRFVVEDERGAVVRGHVDGRGDCAARHAIAPGETARCVVRFDLGRRPMILRHPAGEVPLRFCGPDAPFGLCDLGQVCVDGACAAECGVTHQDGACVNENAVCQGGACVTRCDDSPEGGCEEGVCVHGSCELACHGLALRDDGCWGCLWDVLDAGGCPVEDRCRDCADCVGGRAPGEAGATTCDCLGDNVCEGCEDAGRGYWSCLVEACPACRE